MANVGRWNASCKHQFAATGMAGCGGCYDTENSGIIIGDIDANAPSLRCDKLEVHGKSGTAADVGKFGGGLKRCRHLISLNIYKTLP